MQPIAFPSVLKLSLLAGLRRGLAIAVLPGLLAGLTAGAQNVPRSWNTPWQGSVHLSPGEIARIPRAEVSMKPSETYTLAQLIDIAETNNPETRAAWQQIKVRAAALGVARSELFPTLIATATGRTFLNPPLLYNTFVLQDISLFDSAVHMDYTLIDFGARRSEIDTEKARLLAANLRFNNEHLILIYQVSHAYYALLNAIGLRQAAEVNLQDAQALADAAEDRMNHGLATLPDYLEAKAASARAAYDLQNAIAGEDAAFGHLATILTATPTVRFGVQDLNDLNIPDHLDQSVQDAMDTAMRQRPDLLANIARVRAANAEIRNARSAFFPQIKFEGEKGWLRARGEQAPYAPTYGATWDYDAQLNMNWTIFDGLKRESRLSAAKAERREAEQDVHEQEDRISDNVWNDYVAAQTALEQRKAAAALLTAANESYQAASESYQDGVRNILDVLSAEKTLADARAQDVTARAQVLQTFTSLAFRTGDLLSQARQGAQP